MKFSIHGEPLAGPVEVTGEPYNPDDLLEDIVFTRRQAEAVIEKWQFAPHEYGLVRGYEYIEDAAAFVLAVAVDGEMTITFWYAEDDDQYKLSGSALDFQFEVTK